MAIGSAAEACSQVTLSFFFSHYPLPHLREIKTTTMLLLAMGSFVLSCVPPQRMAVVALTSGKKVSSENDSSPLSPHTHTRERKTRLFWTDEGFFSPFVFAVHSPSSSPLSLPESVVVGGRISPPFLSPSPFA